MNQDQSALDSRHGSAGPGAEKTASRPMEPGASRPGGGKGRGFAGMDPRKQRAIASEGGKAAHASGHAHEFTSDEARRAGALSHGGRGKRIETGGEGGGER